MKMERLNTRWIAFVASIWIQCSCGVTYTFGIYSSVLKSSQSYDQSTLDTVSVFKDFGGNAGILSGLLYTAVVGDHLRSSSRFRGPWVVFLVGAVQYFFGYFFMWLSVVGLIPKPPLPLMCFFMFLAAHAQTFYNTTNVVSALQNFSDYGGTAVGIMKGFLGISGAMLIQMYQTVCGGDPATYILMLAITPTLLALILMPLVRIYDTKSVNDKKHLDRLSGTSLIICLYLMIVIILENVYGVGPWTQTSVFVVMIVLLALPLWVADKAHKEEKEGFMALDVPSVEITPLIKHPDPVEDLVQIETQSNEIQPIQNMNPLQAMWTLNFWLLFLAMVCGMGSGLATVNNIRQIGESLHYSTIELNSLVSLWSIWNFLGRFGAGYISDIYMHKSGCPRPVFMVLTLGVMSIGHLIIASGFQGNLYIGSVLVGVAYGSQWSLMPTITSELFGIRHMGTIYNTIAVASPVGSYIFSVRVIGYFYDKVASEDDNSCYGSHCFMSSFFIMASMAFVGVLVSCVLLFRTRMFYKQIVAKRMTN